MDSKYKNCVCVFVSVSFIHVGYILDLPLMDIMKPPSMKYFAPDSNLNNRDIGT